MINDFRDVVGVWSDIVCIDELVDESFCIVLLQVFLGEYFSTADVN